MSPTDLNTQPKKANIKSTPSENRRMDNTEEPIVPQTAQPAAGLKELLTPLIEEVQSLKENMDRNYNRLDEKYTKLEARLDEKYTQLEKAISTQKDESSKDFKDLKEVITKQ